MKIRVFKIGGNVVDNQSALEGFATDFAKISGPKVLIHGGGALASRMQKNLGSEPVMIAGRRVTDGETLKIVTMVYAGWCNKSVVALLQKNAETLKMATIESAKESERGIVDIETLKKTNESLISTFDEVMNIQREGREKRRAAEAEIYRLEGELKEKLLQIQK